MYKSFFIFLIISFLSFGSEITFDKNKKIGLVLSGGGAGIGIKTPIGPINFIISKCNNDFVVYFNIGYFFK